jgi:hypothetical protein
MRAAIIRIGTVAMICAITLGCEKPPLRTAIEPVTLAVAGTLNRMPSLAVSGNRVVAVWTSTKNETMDVYAAVSEDGGAKFSEPQRVNDRLGDVSSNAEQPPRVALAESVITIIWPSRLDGTTDIRMARSKDGGRTFSPSLTLHSSSLTGARGWQSLTAGRGGSVHAVWLDGRDADPAMKHRPHRASKDGGHGHGGDPRQDVYHAVVAPDGRVIESHVARNVCFCCKTAVGVGPSGRVDVVWRHIFPESMRDIAMASSTDGGRTFSPLARISEDNWQLSGCPDDGPAMAIDAHGSAHIAWPTLVNDTAPQKAIFYTSTRDGRSFAPRRRLSTADQEDAAHPQIAVDTAGNVAAVWDEQQGDTRRIVMRVAAESTSSFDAPRALSDGTSVFHPHIVGVNGGFLVAWGMRTGDNSAIIVQRVTVDP